MIVNASLGSLEVLVSTAPQQTTDSGAKLLPRAWRHTLRRYTPHPRQLTKVCCVQNRIYCLWAIVNRWPLENVFDAVNRYNICQCNVLSLRALRSSGRSSAITDQSYASVPTPRCSRFVAVCGPLWRLPNRNSAASKLYSNPENAMQR